MVLDELTDIWKLILCYLNAQKIRVNIMTNKQRSIYFGGSAVLDRITDYCIGKALFHALIIS